MQSEDYIKPAQSAPSATTPPLGSITAPPPVHASLTSVDISIAVGIVVVMAILLLFVRTGIKNWLVSSKVQLDAANFAATVWYTYLLILTAILSFSVIGGYFAIFTFVIAVPSIALVGLVAAVLITGNARQIRK